MGVVFVLIISALNILLGLIVLAQNSKLFINRLFSMFCLLIASWILATSFLPIYKQDVLGSISFAAGSFIPFFFCVFVNYFPKTLFPIKKLSFILFSLPPIFFSIVSFCNLIIQKNNYTNGEVSVIYGPLFVPFVIYFIVYAFLSFYMLFRKSINSAGLARTQINVLTRGVFLFMALSLTTNIFLPVFKINMFINFGPAFSLIMVGSLAYSIVRQGLFDIRLAAVRSLTYSLLIATLAGIYAGSTFAISSVFRFGQTTPAQIAMNVVISLALVFLFQPLRKFFDHITNRVFYKDNYNSDEFFGRLNKTLAITTDLRELLKRAAKEIGTTLKSSQAFFYIYTSGDQYHITAGTNNHTELPNSAVDDIRRYSVSKPGIIVAMILDDDDAIKQILADHKIEIVLPLIQDKMTIGFLCLGENMGSNYTDRDVSVLNTISNGLIIAIQNALAVQEIQDFNVTLRQRIAEATQELRVKNAMLKKLDKAKDEFVSMASHQLRTPLTSVKGYISMVIDGDAGKITDQQKLLLDEAFTSSEKMVNLVNDFLNVSRIQTGKFTLEKTPVDLAKLVDEEVNGLVQSATKRQIKLDYQAPSSVPDLNVDAGKIRQVVMNYIDNAIYYSNPDSTIKIELAVDGDEVVLTVKDTGIGVPVSEQAGLFTKFYRASNAKKQRPDGTGVGLYLAKKIITAHDGKIVFSTIEGKGSTFGFRLPINELKISADKEIENLKD